MPCGAGRSEINPGYKIESRKGDIDEIVIDNALKIPAGELKTLGANGLRQV